MEFPVESLPILAGIITNTGKAMATTMKYVYAVSIKDFYNIGIKDVFRVALIDPTDATKLQNLGIDIDKKEIRDVFDSVEFQRVQHMICYHLATRIPFYKKQIEGLSVKDKQLKVIFDTVINEGADNFGGLINESFAENVKMAKHKQFVAPSFSSEWFRRYIYTYMPKLGEINNKNLYFLGCVEAMFPLYYSALIAQMKKVVFLLQK